MTLPIPYYYNYFITVPGRDIWKMKNGIDLEKCRQCGLCAEICPVGLLEQEFIEKIIIALILGYPKYKYKKAVQREHRKINWIN